MLTCMHTMQAVIPWISDVKMLWDSNLSYKIETYGILKNYNQISVKQFYEWFVSSE